MREMPEPGCDNDTVSPTPAQQARAAAIAAEITARLAAVTSSCPAPLTDRMTRCGHPGCRCHADPPQLHGPYHQWTRKINGKTATRILSDEDADGYRPWFDNHRLLRSSSPNSKPSPSSSPGDPGHHAPSREISPLSAGSAHRKPAKPQVSEFCR